MAIEWATIAKVASASVTLVGDADDDFLKKLVILLVGFFMFVVVLTSALFYIVTTPSMWFGDFLDLKDKYGDIFLEYVPQTEFVGKFPYPCEPYAPITSDYGTRVHPVTGVTKKHTGIDFGTSWHSPITSIADGVVHSKGYDKSFGRYVTIKHDDPDFGTFYSFYAHLSDFTVEKGQIVQMFQVIGKEGGDPNRDTYPGLSTGHHLHFEIRTSPYYGSDVDPKLYIMEN